jgi:hypothetical protein
MKRPRTSPGWKSRDRSGSIRQVLKGDISPSDHLDLDALVRAASEGSRRA